MGTEVLLLLAQNLPFYLSQPEWPDPLLHRLLLWVSFNIFI